jgi:serine/threonine protein kinase
MTWQVINLRVLNSGGNADLYIGQRSDNGENVVVKFLRECDQPHARKAFARELGVLARKHRGLVPLLACDPNADRPYYVMPYLTGGSLTQYAGSFTDSQLHIIATEVANSLASIHAAGDAHGDIKPDNILLSQDGHLQVADPLGKGAMFTMLFAPNHGGTPGYWAPEVRAHGPISFAGDVYSYGAMLYHLLTGRKPQDGKKLDPASEGNFNAPKIGEIIVACCHFNPSTRPAMQEVLRLLRGERWSDIQAARRQSEALASAILTIGGLAVVAIVLGRGRSGR